MFPRFRITSLAVLVLASGSTALAWKPKTHVHLAETAHADAVVDGKVTIFAVDYPNGAVRKDAGGKPVVIGTYNVNPAVLAAIKAHPAQFRAGVLGPDAYPDIATGQQIIHPAGSKGPGETDADLNRGGPGTDPWLQHLWSKAYGANGTPDSTDACRAFVAGFLTHAAGDIYGHTLVNHYTGDAFHFAPRQENAIKHVVLEGYIGLRTPSPTYDARIDGGVAEFIHRNMVDARPGSILEARLLTGENIRFSPPAIFCKLRRDLQADIDEYNSRKARFDRDIDDAGVLDKIRLKGEKAAYQARNGLRIEYKEHWVEDIDDGLKAWPALSHEVALALFFNAGEKADLDRTRALLDNYVNRHLLSMLGTPDFVGATRAIVGQWIDAVLNALDIPALKQAIEAIRTSLYDFVLRSAFGMTTDELKKYLNSPETQFDPVMTNDAFFTEGGTKISRADFDGKELRLSGATFEYEKVPAAYNTVVLTKLLLMDPAEVNRLMRDLGSGRTLGQPSSILGFARTLDGSNQWSVNPEKMVAAEDVVAYRKIFMRQSGEKP
jgi:hypothetical protein